MKCNKLYKDSDLRRLNTLKHEHAKLLINSRQYHIFFFFFWSKAKKKATRKWQREDISYYKYFSSVIGVVNIRVF